MNKRVTVTIILTCFNRKNKTFECLNSLCGSNQAVDFRFIIVDDNSSDGTLQLVETYPWEIELIRGDGNLYWSGGMRKGIAHYFTSARQTDYVLFINDDVKFFPQVLEKLVYESKLNNGAVIVGATCDDKGEFTYGAIKLLERRKNDLYRKVSPTEGKIFCNTFNANCVLLENEILQKLGNFDVHYHHSLADLDYGFQISRSGYRILSSSEYVGTCNLNSINGTWRDVSLRKIERFKKKESFKGSPFREWFYFIKKNFGLYMAIRYSISPYIRILIGK